MKNILILSSPRPHVAAGIVAYDIYSKLNCYKNTNIKMLVKLPGKYGDKNILSIENHLQHNMKRIIRKAFSIFSSFNPKKKLAEKRDRKYILNYDQTYTFYSTDRILKKIEFKPDIIFVFFMHDFISFKNLAELYHKTGAKIYLYPMDMAPLTGGCHYAWDCDGYKNNCGNCPALYSQDEHDQTFKNMLYKQTYIKDINISLLSVNQQLTNQIKVSTLFKNNEVISNLYLIPDESIFFPQSKTEARRYFDVPNDVKVFFFGACSLADERKGMRVLVDALKIVASNQDKNNKILLLIAGMNMHGIASELDFDYKYIGFIKDYKTLALAYNASDFFISPSLEDTGPTMVLQSLLCKIPVISFAIGFSLEFISNGINGFIVKERNKFGLAEAINNAIALEDDNYDNLIENLKRSTKNLTSEKVIEKIANIIGLSNDKIC